MRLRQVARRLLHADIGGMARVFERRRFRGVRIAAVVAAVAASLMVLPSPAQCQFVGRTFGPAPSPLLFPPPPPPPPPPKIEVPPIPRMDELPPASKAGRSPRSSYSDRMVRCLDEAAALGLGAADRAAYSAACAHRE